MPQSLGAGGATILAKDKLQGVRNLLKALNTKSTRSSVYMLYEMYKGYERNEGYEAPLLTGRIVISCVFY